MIAACREFRQSIWPEYPPEVDEENSYFVVEGHDIQEENIELENISFVGCGAHRMNLVIFEAT